MPRALDAESLVALLLHANQLKRVDRSGWAMRGIADVESVSDHSFGVAFVALVLAQFVDEPVDRAKLLTIALLHDLPETVLGDIPRPASRYLSPDAKSKAEHAALEDLLEGVPQGNQWRSWWREFDERSGTEGNIVRDADRLEMMFQAYVYEQTTGNRFLEEFWSETSGVSFANPVARSLFNALKEMREQARGDSCVG